jgi:putative glutamine amidotransferase
MISRRRREQPLIGITADTVFDPDVSSQIAQEPAIFLFQRYTQAILACSAIPIILPPLAAPGEIEALLQSLDGILVSGGNFDIDPKLYGEEAGPDLGAFKRQRTQFELELIRLALQRNMPILGICGGEQAINVVLGGSLYQDIRRQIPHAREHQLSAMRQQSGHLIKIRAGTKLRDIVAEEQLNVNTTHHQSVKALGRGLIASASSEDGVIEGIESAAHAFVIGVQWHPELLLHKDPAETRIFMAFVAACAAGESPPC